MQQPPNGYQPGPYTYYYPWQPPNAPAPQQPSRRDKAMAIGVVIGAVVLIWCIISYSQQSSVQTPGRIGDTITLDSIDCTLVSVSSVNGVGVIADVKIKNNSSSVFNLSYIDFKLEDSKGVISDPSTGNIQNALAPSGEVEGLIYFSNVTSPQNDKLLWQPIGYTDEVTHAWLLDKINTSN